MKGGKESILRSFSLQDEMPQFGKINLKPKHHVSLMVLFHQFGLAK